MNPWIISVRKVTVFLIEIVSFGHFCFLLAALEGPYLLLFVSFITDFRISNSNQVFL